MDIETTHKRDIYGCETCRMRCIWCSSGALKNITKNSTEI